MRLLNKYAANTEKKISEPVSILLPVSNEFEVIESVIAELVEVVYRYLPAGSEFIIEEAGSTDGTKELLIRLNERWPFLNITYKEKKEGFGKAAHELYKKAKCLWVFFIDSDGQCVASEFWKLAYFMENYDFITGRKKPRYDPFSRRVLSKIFNLMAKSLFKLDLHDMNFSFRLSKREAVLDCLNRCRYMSTLINAESIIIANSLGYRIHEVDVYHRPRLSGSSRGLAPSSILEESVLAFRGLFRLRQDISKIVKNGKNHV
jgi:hypothetical protein